MCNDNMPNIVKQRILAIRSPFSLELLMKKFENEGFYYCCPDFVLEALDSLIEEKKLRQIFVEGREILIPCENGNSYPSVDYDPNYDVLYIALKDKSNSYAEETDSGIIVMRDNETSEITGFTIPKLIHTIENNMLAPGRAVQGYQPKCGNAAIRRK